MHKYLQNVERGQMTFISIQNKILCPTKQDRVNIQKMLR